MRGLTNHTFDLVMNAKYHHLMTEGINQVQQLTVIRILVAPKFSEGAVSQVSTSEFNILLTNEFDLVSDLVKFIETRLIVSTLELTLEKLLELIGFQQKDIVVEEISKRLEVLEIEIRKTLENLELILSLESLRREIKDIIIIFINKYLYFHWVNINKKFFVA